MTPSAARRFLHIANGSSTTGTFREAGIPGTASLWADVLHEGPVPGGISDDELMQVRARHLAGTCAAGSVDETLAELRRWRAVLDDRGSYDELILWYEHDLFDQLNLIQVLSLLRQGPSIATPVSLISIGSFPGRPDFKGLGELTADELASLLETRQPVSDAQLALAERAWRAFRSSDPRRLEELVRADTSVLPFLAAALRRHLEEFPWTSDGLSRTERRLMELAQDGPVDLWAAFPRMHEHETAFYIADASLWQVVRELSSASRPLIAVAETETAAAAEIADGADTPTGLPRRAAISLTEIGRTVLARRADRVSRCGLDKWLGGVHLQGAGPMWRWDSEHGRMAHG